MEREHTRSADSLVPFETPNYLIETTPAIEWNFVTDPDEGLRRFATELRQLREEAEQRAAAAAGGGTATATAGGSAAAAAAGGKAASAYPAESRTRVGDETHMRKPLPPSAFAAPLASTNEKLHALSQPPLLHAEFVGARLCTAVARSDTITYMDMDMGCSNTSTYMGCSNTSTYMGCSNTSTYMACSNTIIHHHEACRAPSYLCTTRPWQIARAHLSRSHCVLRVLRVADTGPCYVKYNGVLRGLQLSFARWQYEELCKGNKYTTTLHVCRCGPRSRDLWVALSLSAACWLACCTPRS
jgi:hypothetical protein